MFNYFINLFGAEKIDLSSIEALSKDSANLIIYAIPVMAILTILEIWYSWKHEKESYNTTEALGSLFVGLGNVGINLLFKAALITGSVLIYNWIPWRMEMDWWTLIPCILLFDFCSYWSHRISHFNRFFWSTHVVHHSAETYNLTVSFRLSWIQHFKILFFIPLAFVGFHPVIFFIANQISVLFQFWQHTEHIPKLHPWIEKVFVTPSNHRVHHGSEEMYIDKNFSAIFIFWDKLFNTYQPETDRPTYGLTKKIDRSMNPIYLNFHEFRDICIDVKNAKGIRKKLFYLFGSPGDVYREKLRQKELEKE